MSYSDVVIKALNNALCDDQGAYDYLIQNNYAELAALTDYLCNDNTNAFNFILRNRSRFHIVVDFLAALGKNQKAFRSLFEKDKRLAAAVYYVNYNDEEAYNWLEKNKFYCFLDLADIIAEVVDKNLYCLESISYEDGFMRGNAHFGGFDSLGDFGFSGGGSTDRW